jgi:hypothetical protein
MSERESEIDGPFEDIQPIPTVPSDPRLESPADPRKEEVHQLSIPDDPSEV